MTNLLHSIILNFKNKSILKERLNKNDIKKIVLNNDNDIKNNFVRTFKHDIDLFINTALEVHLLLVELDKKYGKDKTKIHSLAFINNAFQNLICSMSLYILGYPVPSGNLMRHFIESISMTILLIDYKSKYYKDFIKLGSDFKVNDAPFIVNRNAKTLHINEKGWYILLMKRKFFNLGSHASAFALSNIINFSSQGIVLGALFDDERNIIYKKDITGKINAAECLKDFVTDLDKMYCKN